MRITKTCCYLLLALFGVAGGLFGQATGNRVFALPSGSSLNITVLDANTLANVGTIPATPNVFQVLATPDGSKYYVLSNNSTRTVTVVNASNLAVTRQV